MPPRGGIWTPGKLPTSHLQRHDFRALRQRTRVANGVRRENQAGLEVDHDKQSDREAGQYGQRCG